MIGIFRQKASGNIILLLVLGILIKLPAFFDSKGIILKKGDGVFYTTLISFIGGTNASNALSYNTLAFCLNMAIAFILINFINTDRLMHRSNFLAGMAYLLITSFLPAFNYLSSTLVASLFILLSFRILFKTHHTKADKSNIFNAGFLISIASLFFLPSLLFIFWAVLALTVLRPFKFTELVVLLIGFTTPYYFYAAYLFLNDDFAIPEYFYHLSFLSSNVNYSFWHAGGLFLMLAPLLVGFYYVYSNTGKMIIHIRKAWYLLLVYLLVAIPVSFFDMENTSENIIIALVPIAAFHGYGYLNAEIKLYPRIAFWAAIIFIVSAQIYSELW